MIYHKDGSKGGYMTIIQENETFTILGSDGETFMEGIKTEAAALRIIERELWR